MTCSIGDPHETEVDCILLLTENRYLVAEYDSHLDKIVQFQKISLKDISEIELGMHQQQTKIFQGSIAPQQCIRLNYSIDGIDGYFHMFRSPNIRFFNNVAVVIKTPDEILGKYFRPTFDYNPSALRLTELLHNLFTESLTAIVEFFRIALESRGITNVKFSINGTLQRKKSRTPVTENAKVSWLCNQFFLLIN